VERIDEAEIERMTTAQEGIFRDYISPGLIFATWGNSKKKEIIDTALKTAMKYPHDLKYREMTSGIIQITGKTGSKNSSHIPADLEILVNKNGNLIKVNGITISTTSREEYARMYDEQDYSEWINCISSTNNRVYYQKYYKDYYNGIADTERDKMINKEILESPSGELKMIIEIYNMILPQRLKEMLDIRNEAGKIDDLSVKAGENYTPYGNFLDSLNGNARTYKEIENDKSKFRVIISVYSKDPLIYMIEGMYEPSLFITAEGYILDTDENNEPVMDSRGRYKDIIRKRYKSQNTDNATSAK
jgi:hypothetical protein